MKKARQTFANKTEHGCEPGAMNTSSASMRVPEPDVKHKRVKRPKCNDRMAHGTWYTLPHDPQSTDLVGGSFFDMYKLRRDAKHLSGNLDHFRVKALPHFTATVRDKDGAVCNRANEGWCVCVGRGGGGGKKI